MDFGSEARFLLCSAVNVCQIETKTVGLVYYIGGILYNTYKPWVWHTCREGESTCSRYLGSVEANKDDVKASFRLKSMNGES